MKRILTALVLIPLVILLVFFAPDWLVTLATAAVAILAAWEFLGIAQHTAAKPPHIPILVSIGLLFLVSFEWPDKLLTTVGVLSLALLVYCAFACPIAEVLASATSSIFCLIYTGLTLIAIPFLRSSEDGKSALIFLFCAVWCGDIAALYIGRAWGRRKLAPGLSPNKTWEGAAGSVLGSLLVTVLLLILSVQLGKRELHFLAFDGSVGYWLLMAVLVNIAAQVGDLAESALKRSAGVKDSGTMLPGHGGILDRIDALLLAAPIFWYAQVIQHF
jgi:phosphatidate cytidylyltransferase